MAQLASERACDRCRERRVKCDKRHPSCLRCEKSGKPCPGYDKKRKFVDEGETLRKKYQSSFTPDVSSSTVTFASPRKYPASPGKPTTPDVLAKLPTRASRSIPTDLPQSVSPAIGTHALTSTVANPLVLSDIVLDRPLNLLDPDPTDQALGHDWMDDTFDPAWFNINPTEAYAQGMNSCGFIPNLPNIADEVDKPELATLSAVETVPTPASINTLIDSSWVSEAQWNTSAIIRDEREHEMAFLIRHFTVYIGPWMDLFNDDRHFEQLVPLKALRDALLRNAIAAVAAKQLGRVHGTRSSTSHPQHQEPALMESLDTQAQVNWFYKAANYYDKAIAFSRVYLQALSGSMSEALTPNSSNTLSVANSEDLLVAVSLFSLYESLDSTNSGWLQHLAGLKSLLAAVHDQKGPSYSISETTAGRDAAFWNFARADYQAAYIHGQTTLLDVQDFPLWRRYGLQVQSDGSLYSDPSEVKSDRALLKPMTQLVSHTLLWLVLCVVNYIVMDSLTTSERQTAWDKLTRQMDQWRASLPSTFEPCAQITRPMCPLASPKKCAQIKEVFFSVNQCAAAMHLYHFARILLLLNKPDLRDSTGRLQAYRKVISDANKHAQQIIGIALGRPHPAVRVEMLLPLHMSGTCLEDDDERRVVLHLLRSIERDTGCSTESRVQNLLSEWSWPVEASA